CGRRQVIARVAEAWPGLVGLGGSLEIEEGLDALVLGILSTGFEQPAVDALALLAAGDCDLLQAGMRMVHEIADQPQFERMQARNVAAIVQVKTLWRVSVVEL